MSRHLLTEPRALVRSIYAPPFPRRPWNVAHFFPGRPMGLYSFARLALLDLLKAIGTKPGDGVLLPEFICRDLLAPIRAAGAAPLFYPVDTRLKPASPERHWPKARAVVAVNYFGFAQDLEPFRRYAERNGAVLIEDNAHGLFSRDADQAWLGSRADFGLLSIRKTVPLPNGAALIQNRDGFAYTPPSHFVDFAPAGHQAKTLLRKALGAIGHKPVQWLTSLKRVVRKPVVSNPRGELELPEPALPCKELAHPIQLCDPDMEIARRRELYHFTRALLAETGAEPVFESLPPGAAPYVYPFRAQGKTLLRAQRALKKAGLDLFPWPDLPAAVCSSAPPHYLDVWCVRFLW